MKDWIIKDRQSLCNDRSCAALVGGDGTCFGACFYELCVSFLVFMLPFGVIINDDDNSFLFIVILRTHVETNTQTQRRHILVSRFTRSVVR